MKKGTIVDSTIIECSSSKHYCDKARDTDASWTKKQAITSTASKIVDGGSGLTTSIKTITSKVHDVTVDNDLLQCDAGEVLGD